MSLEENGQVTTVNDVVEKYLSGHRYYSDLREKYVSYYKKYRGWLEINSVKDYYKWRSKLFIPAIARAIDGIVVNLWLTMFPSDPFFQAKPREEGDVKRAALLEYLLSYQFEEGQLKLNFFKFLVQLGIYGTTFGKVYFKKETRKIKRRRQKFFMNIPLPGEYELREEEETIANYPVFEPIDIFDVIVSPKATCLDDTWVIHRSEKTLGELKDLQKDGTYSNVSELENFIYERENDRNDADSRKISGQDAWGKETGDDRRVEILEYWNMKRTKIVTVGGRSVKLREKDNKMYIDPFICATLWDLPFELYAIGVAEKANDLQDQLNLEVNSRLDNRSLKQNFILKVRRGAGFNVRQLQSKPGAIWLGDDLTGLEPVTIPDVASNTSFAEESDLKQEIEEITGVTKYATGAGVEGGRKTATEVSTLTRSTSKGFAVFVDKIIEQALKPICKKFSILNELFLDDDVVLRVLGKSGEEFVRIRPDEIMGNYDFIFAGSSGLTDKNMTAQHLVQFLGLAKEDPGLNRQAVYRKFWEALGYKDYVELIQPVPQMPMGLPPGMPGGMPGGMPALPPPNPNITGLRPATPMEGGMPIGMGMGGQRP